MNNLILLIQPLRSPDIELYIWVPEYRTRSCQDSPGLWIQLFPAQRCSAGGVLEGCRRTHVPLWEIPPQSHILPAGGVFLIHPKVFPEPAVVLSLTPVTMDEPLNGYYRGVPLSKINAVHTVLTFFHVAPTHLDDSWWSILCFSWQLSCRLLISFPHFSFRFTVSLSLVSCWISSLRLFLVYPLPFLSVLIRSSAILLKLLSTLKQIKGSK